MDKDTSTQRPHPFAILPMKSMPQYKLPLTVNQEADYNYYGIFNPSHISESASAYIALHTNATQDIIQAQMDHFLSLTANNCLQTGNSLDRDNLTEACWLTVRMWRPTTAWKQPRWHRDGTMFDCTCSTPQMPHSKYAFCLLGPQTRVLRPSQELDGVFEDTIRASNEDAETERSLLAERLEGLEEVKLREGEIIRFSWGQGDSPVHSEPDCTGVDRVFVSVLFGSEREIGDMCRFRGEEFCG